MAHFTKAEIEEIRRRLSQETVKDTEFPEATELTSDDTVAIVQNGTNRRISVNTFRDELQNGPQGERGYSAYEIAVQHGWKGTEEEWLARWLNALTTYHLSLSEYEHQRDANTLDAQTWYMVYSNTQTTKLLKVCIGYTILAERSEEGDTGFAYTFPIIF